MGIAILEGIRKKSDVYNWKAVDATALNVEWYRWAILVTEWWCQVMWFSKWWTNHGNFPNEAKWHLISNYKAVVFLEHPM